MYFISFKISTTYTGKLHDSIIILPGRIFFNIVSSSKFKANLENNQGIKSWIRWDDNLNMNPMYICFIDIYDYFGNIINVLTINCLLIKYFILEHITIGVMNLKHQSPMLEMKLFHISPLLLKFPTITIFICRIFWDASQNDPS